MNIFLDSCVLHEDYFFIGKGHASSRKILEYAEEGLISLYMADVVRLELRRQYEKELEEKNKVINKHNKDTDRLKIEDSISIINVEEQLDSFDEFYDNLIYNVDNFIILPCKDEFMQDVLKRAIYKSKPFSEGKSELKDALIWKTYFEQAEQNGLDNCILLTNNTTDFCGKDKSKIHPELALDSQKFKVINSTFQFIKELGAEIETPERRMVVYAERTEIDEEFVLNHIEESFVDRIIKHTEKVIEGMNPCDVFDNDFYMDGYVTGSYSETLCCNNVSYEVIGDLLYIYGKLSIAFDSESYVYNASRDKGEDHFHFVGDATLIFDVTFSFDVDHEGIDGDIEISDTTLQDVC